MKRPKAYGYVRVSTLAQETSQQRDFVVAYYKARLQESHEWGGLFEDEGISAYSTNWLERPGGRAMWAKVGLGDAIIIQRIDRAVRGMRDAADCWKHLESKQVDLHCVDGGKQMGGASGRFVYQIHSAVSELSSGLTSARTREMKTAATLRGECTDRSPRPGYSKVASSGKRPSGKPVWIQVPNMTERRIIQAALDDFRNQRTLGNICDTLGAAGLYRSNKQLFSRQWMRWAMHCLLLDWPLTLSYEGFRKYFNEAKAYRYVVGKFQREYLVSSLAFVEKLKDEGYDFTKKRIGYPHIPNTTMLD